MDPDFTSLMLLAAAVTVIAALVGGWVASLAFDGGFELVTGLLPTGNEWWGIVGGALTAFGALAPEQPSFDARCHGAETVESRVTPAGEQNCPESRGLISRALDDKKRIGLMLFGVEERTQACERRVTNLALR